MSAGMPELGSKISLISKADIRYEGRLFTVDPQECTIALSNVRSFGTEDRETQYPIAPQNQVYDYILFRGSDIKDIRVVNNVGPLQNVPNDPAIVQLSVPAGLGSSAYHQAGGFSHPVLGPMGPGLTPYPGAYGAMGAMTGLPSAVAPGMSLHRDPRSLSKQPSELVNPVQVPENSTNKDQDLIGGSSRSATPSLVTRKSPTMDQGVQVNQPVSTPIKDDKKPQQQLPPQTRQIQTPYSARDGPVSRSTGSQQQQYHPQPQREQREREPVHSKEPQSRDQQPAPLPQRTSQQQQQQQHHQQQQTPGRGGWVNRGGMRRGRGRGGPSSGGFNRPPGSGQQQTGTGGKPKNTLKFENDFDFEQANKEFDTLRNQLAKTKIDSEPVITGDGKVNDDNEKKDDSGNETGAGEGEQEEEQQIFYDKTKSFFDNISCEAVERSKGRSQRTDWRTERKLNSETFGVASARRGGYRGRGYYGNRGMGGGMYRGGNYRGGYRSQGVQRGGRTSNTSGNTGGSTGNPQQRVVTQQNK
ncbi:protein LSM14 homolog A-B isoform X2 [Zootermopsis nevadensis]|uniref:LSM14-like protein B n=1 Tax=Zootermopsis nevadensis TaxID=136037 RepID=A0A067QZ21_ZOONE|nr:protein LSM14 homolog A-B isoform X2 [Zootermopsis nevadensis]KDR15799.1 LSM14-like protein B [Zootermopsis nevadensis]